MAQGDTFNDVHALSLTANATTYVDVRPASGNHVTVNESVSSRNTTHGSGGAYYYDYVNSTETVETHKIGSNYEQYTHKRHISNDVGIRWNLPNNNCSAVNAEIAVSGVQHK